MLFFVISAIIIFLDQVTKYFILNRIDFKGSITIVNNFLYIVHWNNYGAAFGILQNARNFFIVFTVVVAAIIVYFIYKTTNSVLRLSLSFLLGGAIGNLIDRVKSGGVIDFIDFHIMGFHYPTFNVADIFIVVGAIMLSYYILFLSDEKILR